mmetsp:Transcript_68178/g.197445  ORF Transcript_68178/g.197445 Transcript_68178/m.197445 type:complete len:504 (+) Transcript_68178:692-2203(+)
MVRECQGRDAAQTPASEVLVEERQLDLVRHEDRRDGATAQREDGVRQCQHLENADRHREGAAHCCAEGGSAEDGETGVERALHLVGDRGAVLVLEHEIRDEVRQEVRIATADKTTDDHRRGDDTRWHGHRQGHECGEPLDQETAEQGAADAQGVDDPLLAVDDHLLREQLRHEHGLVSPVEQREGCCANARDDGDHRANQQVSPLEIVYGAKGLGQRRAHALLLFAPEQGLLCRAVPCRRRGRRRLRSEAKTLKGLRALVVHPDPMAAQETANDSQPDVQAHPQTRVLGSGALAGKHIRTDERQQARGAGKPCAKDLIHERPRDAGEEAAPIGREVLDLGQHELHGEDDAPHGGGEGGANAHCARRQEQLGDLVLPHRATGALRDEVPVQVPRDAGGHVAVRPFLPHGETGSKHHRQAEGLDEEHPHSQVVVQNGAEQHRLHLREAAPLALHGGPDNEARDDHQDDVLHDDARQPRPIRESGEALPEDARDECELVDSEGQRA